MKNEKNFIRDMLLLLKKMYYMFFKKHTMMTCEEAAQQLYEYLDKELSPADYNKIKLHLELCRECCQHFDFEEILRSLLRSEARSERLPTHLKESILKEIEDLK